MLTLFPMVHGGEGRGEGGDGRGDQGGVQIDLTRQAPPTFDSRPNLLTFWLFQNVFEPLAPGHCSSYPLHPFPPSPLSEYKIRLEAYFIR